MYPRKSILFILISSLLLITACSFIGTEPTPPPPTATSLPPTNTPMPPTETPTPTATPQTAWLDDFQDAFTLDWTWIDENPARWSLSENPGFLRIYAAPYAEGGKNILVLLTPEGDFTAVTHMYFEPVKNFQFAGLTLFLDDENKVNFGRAYCAPSASCVGNGLYLDHVEGAGMIGSNFATTVENTNETWLKLERIDVAITGSYSPDGVTWTVIGTHILSPLLDGARIGLFAAQDLDKSDDDIPAVFDSFDLTLLP